MNVSVTNYSEQARRVDFVEGGCVFLGGIFIAPKARASRRAWGHIPPGTFANLGSLKCHFLHFDIISEVKCLFLQY